MIKEAIAFVEKFESNQTQQENRKDWKGKKFIIINTKDDNGKLVYDCSKILEDDDSIKSWIDKNEHYRNLLNGINNFLRVKKNKGIGSNVGLSYAPFCFKLSVSLIENIQDRINWFNFTKEDVYFGLDDFKDIYQVYDDFTHSFSYNEKVGNDSYLYDEFYVLINVNKEKLDIWINSTNKFIINRESEGKKSINGRCSNCGNKGSTSQSQFQTAFDSNKLFLFHKTRNGIEEGYPLLLCPICVYTLNRFEKILKDNRIRIFPLFINPNEVREEIKIIKGDLDEDRNTFAFIFDNIKSRIKKDIYDFYLVVMSGNYFFFDYVTGYKWDLGNYTQFFGKEEKQYPINRQGLEIKICNVLAGGTWINYFEDKIKGSDNQQISLIYAVRQKIFDFVYRNQSNLTSKDLISIIVFRIEKEIRNDSVKNFECREFLNLYFNKNLLEGNKMDKEKILLNRIKPMKDALILGNFDEFEIRDDEEWAYWAGQIAYFLVSRSKSKDKTFGLLEPFTNKSTTLLVRITIRELFEKYKHDIGLANQRFKAIICKVLAYEINKSFMDLKINFYVGVFDDNVIYSKKEEKPMEVE